MTSVTFPLSSEFVEVNQLLKLVGACSSGGEGKALVAANLVFVDGLPETRKTAKIRSGQVVTFGDLKILVVGPSR